MDKQQDIFSKALNWVEADKVKSLGLYPYFRPIQETSGSTVVSHGRRRVMIGSNNYLGLTHHPRVMEAARRAVLKYGTGCTGSRFLNGNLEVHEELEHAIAKFVDKEACLVLTTGFLSNLSVLSSLCGRHDVIYSDRENHASIVAGQQLALSPTIKFKHNDAEDLERVLSMTRSQYKGALIVADGVFSMSGDILNLPAIARVAKKYNCRLYIDDAHSLGVLGDKGQGTAHHFDLTKETDLVMATFSKSFASLGGFIAGEARVINYIKHNARPFIFSAAMPPSAVATVLECLKVLQEEPQHLQALKQNARKMSQGFKQLGFNTLNSVTPIVPILIGDDLAAFSFTQKLYEHGVFATPVVSPAVPKGCALIRTSYMASHREEDLDYVLRVFEVLGKEFGIIGHSENQERLAHLARAHFGVVASL